MAAQIDNKREKKINFVLSKQEYEIIKCVQNQLNLNISDVAREALKIYSWAQTKVDQNEIDSTPSEFIKNAIKVFLWARNGALKNEDVLNPNEIKILL